MNDIQIQDICQAIDAPSSRVSEVLAGLGVFTGNRGRRATTIDLSDAIAASVVCGLVLLGLSTTEALEIVRRIPREDLKAVVARDDPTWLAVANDPENPRGFVFILCTGDEMRDIAATGAGGLRFLNIHAIAKCIIGAALERKQLAPASSPSTRAKAQEYVVKGRRGSGCVIDGLTIAVVRNGRSFRMQLTPAEARAIAEKLLKVADEHSASASASLN